MNLNSSPTTIIFAAMKILMARIKKSSPHYEMGLNHKGKSIWLSITSFRTAGARNFKIKAIKEFSNGHARFQEIWISPEEITLKHVETAQLSLDLYTQEELEENKYNPKFFNRKRFEIITKNEKQYIHATDIEMATKIANEMGLGEYKIRQVKKFTRKELLD